MSDCYNIQEHVSKTPGSLDSCIDCTYVLIMEGSSRESQIKEQVKTAGITSRVIFQYNPGYKKCEKNLRVKKTNYDLEHALKNVCTHALNSGCERILVLEDDCEFDERIKNPEVLNDLHTFFINNNPSVYNLGSFLLLPNPIDVLRDSKHQLLLYNSSTHASVYNKKYMEWISTNECLLGHVDFETNRHVSKYTYKFPLAYQKITETENAREGWGEMYPLLNFLIFKPNNLSYRVQPGYDNIKRWADSISVLLLFIFIYLFIYYCAPNWV
jgi:hypothetical protein